LEVLESLRHATQVYRFRGATAFYEALQRSVGEIALHREPLSQDATKGVMASVTDLMRTGMEWAQRAKPVLELMKLGFDIRAMLRGEAAASPTVPSLPSSSSADTTIV
jgi:hypothetical protein